MGGLMAPTLRRRTWIIVAAVVVPLLAVGGFVTWFATKDDGPAEFALDGGVTFEAVSARDLAGEWEVAEGSEAGYRIKEKLAWLAFESEAVGRTSAVTGKATIAESGDELVVTDVALVADLTKIDSTDARRDRYMKTMGLETDTFPEATFSADGPVTIPAEATEGETVTVDVPGKLTIHGVTNEATIPLSARLNDGQIEVVGSYELTLDDYEIPELLFAQAIDIADQGTLELHLFLSKVGGSLETATQASATTNVITVLAEPSLTGAFQEIEQAYEAANPGVDVQIRFDDSVTLHDLVESGSEADVVALDSDSLMADLAEADLIEEAEAFGTTGLELVVSPSNSTITSVASLNSVDPTMIGICNADFPCGTYARDLLAKNGVTVTPNYTPPIADAVTGDTSGLQMITPVLYGFTTVDVVYVPDVRNAGSAVKGVAIPAADNIEVPYSIAALRSSPNGDGAASFIAFVRSSEGAATLAAAGINAP